MTARHIPFGEPVNQSESKVIEYLISRLPDGYVVLSNLSVNQGGHDYDFDVVVLGKHALYALEIKNYRIIRGNAREWQIQKENGAVEIAPRNPLAQASLQASVLKGSLKGLHPKFGKLFVQDAVCLACEKEPDIRDLDDSPNRKKKIRWYKGIEEFLTDPKALIFPSEWKLKIDDISGFHEEIIQAVQNGFSGGQNGFGSPPPLPKKISGYDIKDRAWTSRRYRAYLASREGHYPERSLLKLYKVPAAEDPSGAKKYVESLRRELDALRAVRDKGDLASGGYKNVSIGYDAFPLYGNDRQIREYMVVMEWVEGKSLRDVITKSRLSVRQKYQIAAQICRGLAFAHSAGVVHRNLNLENIIYDINGVVKIVNFDFAKFLDSTSLSTFTVPGNLPEDVLKTYLDDFMKERKYIAPEIRGGDGLPSYHDATRETDLYALGIVLYELFSGKLLEKNAQLNFATLASSDDKVARGIALLCAESPVERTNLSLMTFSAELTERAQMLQKDEKLPELPSGSSFDAYRIIARISHTAMSDVYQAEHIQSKEKIAIKFLRASSDDAAQELRAAYRAWREIDPRYTARWLGEGVAFALNGKITPGESNDVNALRVHYLVSEYLEGRTLRQFLENEVPPLETALAIGSKIIAAVAAIHEVGWTHRDIKPANLILDLQGNVRVVDFGLSQRVEDPVATKGISPGYAPPEVLGDSSLQWTHQSDVYSTACVALALLFGEEPLQGPKFSPSDESERGKLRQMVGADLANLLLQDVSTDPLQRHASAVEMLQDWQFAINRRAAPMAGINYDKILQKIETLIQERDDELDYGGAAAYRHKATQLTEWLNGGKQGECPVDLSEFGVDVISAPAVKPAAEEMPAPAVTQSVVAKEASTAPKMEKDEAAGLTPEERNIQMQLNEVREHLNLNRFRQAVALAAAVESRASGESKERAAQLLEEARQKREHAVELALKKADSEFTKGDKEQARQRYELALELDPDNERAKTALRKMDGGEAGTKLSEQKIFELRSGLRDNKNIKRLGEAVYEAEALDAEGKLTRELQDLLQKGRKAYDQIRSDQGEDTTMMRMGDLTARKQARENIAVRLAKNEQYIFDATTNEIRPLFDVSKEADILLDEKSSETVQFEIDVVNRLLPSHPVGARARLEDAISKPFHEKDLRKLEQKLEEVNKLIEQQKGAEALLAQAAEHDDNPVKAFGVILTAQSAFSYLPGMEEKISQARTKALDYLVGEMDEAFMLARGLLGGNESAKGRKLINDALHLLDAWPQPEKPEQLQSLLEQGKLLLDFDAQATQVRKEAEDPARVGAALKKLEEMRNNERFRALSEMRSFVSDMDQYRDTGDQLREAREARMAGDWKRVFDLTTKIREGKNAGSMAAQVDALYAEAEQEVRIQDARDLLDNLEIKKANAILSQVIVTEQDVARQTQLKERLKSEQDIINAAIAETQKMQPVFDRAVALRNGREEERLQALRLFRFVGNMGEKPASDLPDFVITLRTADARQAAVDVADSLRAACLPSIEKAFKGDKRKKIEPDEMQRLARLAQILREGALIRSAEERSMLRWAEVEWGSHLAKTKESMQEWATAVEIWERLNENYPGDEDVSKNLEEARRQQEVIQRMLGVADTAKPRDALLALKDALENSEWKRFTPLLKERRDAIFQKAQEELLKTAREALDTGSAKGKIAAFVSIVDLRELEEIVGVAESRRRSAIELKSMNPNDFKNAADVVLQQSNTFSPAQGTVKASIDTVKDIIWRLQMFAKVAPLFPGRLPDLEERLERRRTELSFMHQRLEEVHNLLKEVWQPDLWVDAINRGSFDVLRMKRDAMGAQGLPSFTSIPEIKEFDLKIREWEEAYQYIKEQAGRVKTAFDVQEDFKLALDISRRLASMPSDWKVISHQTYEQILMQMDYLFRVTNVYGGGRTLAGRADIESAALERERQFETWQAWQKTWRLKMQEAEQDGQTVNRYQSLDSAPTGLQLRDWTLFLEKAQSAAEVLRTPPAAKDSILSKKSLEIFESSRAALTVTEDWIYSAHAAIALLDKEPKFPSAQELSDAATRNDIRGLALLLERAKRAGAITDSQKAQQKTYEATLERMKAEAQRLANKKWWDLR